MHWGLTGFERKRIERIALDHPFFDMHAPLLTKKELRVILAQCPRKTGPQVIAEVKKELGMEYVPAIQKKRTLTEALRDASFVPSFRRTVVLGVLCVLLALFMTFTVPGRAFAEEVYSIIIHYINGHLKASNSYPSSKKHDWDFLSLPDDIDSPQALANVLDFSLAVTDDELTSFRYFPMDDQNLVIRSRYHGTDGKTYVLEQTIYADDSSWGYVADINNDSIQIPSSIGIVMYGGVSEDGTSLLAGFTYHVIIQLSSKQHTISELIPVAESLHYTS